MKILALDLGDKWVGSAIADPLGITCRPLKTVTLDELENFLQKILVQEEISTVVVGYPKTLSSGGESEQTKKIRELKEELEQKFAQITISGLKTPVTWILWDERLSSKRAETLKRESKGSHQDKKLKSHSIAAAFILQSYLDYKAFHKNS